VRRKLISTVQPELTVTGSSIQVGILIVKTTSTTELLVLVDDRGTRHGRVYQQRTVSIPTANHCTSSSSSGVQASTRKLMSTP
jgi:hypothetical protein